MGASKAVLASRDLPQHSVSTLRLMIVRSEWPDIIAGTKTQYRRYAGKTQYGADLNPRPILLFSRPDYRAGVLETRMAVLEDVFQERLGAITPEGLAAEGVESLKEFRHRWCARHQRSRFKPLTIVNVFCLSPWREGDRERFGALLLERLYGDWL